MGSLADFPVNTQDIRQVGLANLESAKSCFGTTVLWSLAYAAECVGEPGGDVGHGRVETLTHYLRFWSVRLALWWTGGRQMPAMPDGHIAQRETQKAADNRCGNR